MSTNEIAPAVDIKDYILVNKPSEYEKAASPYHVLLQTSSDFIVSRKKVKSERELVILISENLFYFREKGIVEEVTPGKLRTFLKDLRDDSIALDQVLWLPTLSLKYVERLINIITNDTHIAMCRANVLSDHGNLYWATGYWNKNPQLYTEVHSSIGNFGPCSHRALMATVFEIEKRYGIDMALHFVDAFKRTGIEQYTSAANKYSYIDEMNGFFKLLNEPYGLNPRCLINYVFTDAFSQGITRIDTEFWKTYHEYMDIQIKAFGEIRDKYPKYLMIAHNIMTTNVNLLEQVPSSEGFTELTAEVQGLAHNDKVYSVVIPSSAEQIVQDGISLGHCLGANTKLTASGGLNVLFLRNSNAKDVPLVTLRFDNNRIIGAEGLNRRELTGDERGFLEDWGKKKNVQIAA
jgi:hypothetical protein